MKSSVKVLILAGISAAVFSIPVNAMHINISGEPCPLTIYAEPSAEAAASEVSLSDFELYGYIQGTFLAVKTGDSIGYVTENDLSAKLPDIELFRLPSGEGLTDINRGTNGDASAQIQQQLIQLSYLSGTADGMYGAGTADAVSRFQADHRLEQTGNADVYTQMLIQLQVNGLPDILETKYPTVYTVEEEFAAVLPRTDEDLSPFAGPEWKLTFDQYENSGTLDPGISLGGYRQDGAAIDQLSLEAFLQIVLAADETTGRLILKPAVVTKSAGAYRPYVQSVTFSAPEMALKTDGNTLTGELDGALLKETGYCYITPEQLALLAGGNVSEIRISGKNQDFDFSVEEAAREKISWFAQILMG